MADSDEADALAMTRLRDGEDLALNELMARWQHPLVNYLARMCGNEATALDLAQDTFVRVYEARAIAALEAEYEPRCAAMCERIAEANQRLEKLLASSKAMTPELETALRDASQTQADCRAATMAQAFAISAHMPPEHAARYRAMIAARILPGTLRHDTATHH